MLFLVLALSLSASACKREPRWQVSPKPSVVRVPADWLQARGGETDCLVHWEGKAGQEPSRPSIIRCPSTMADAVLEAAAQWEITVRRRKASGLGVVMVRPERSAEESQEHPEAIAVTHAQVRYRQQSAPELPREFTALGGDLVARCTTRLYMDEQGEPYDTDLEQCPQWFRASVTKALALWRIYPMSVDGIPVKVSFPVSFMFVQD